MDGVFDDEEDDTAEGNEERETSWVLSIRLPEHLAMPAARGIPYRVIDPAQGIPQAAHPRRGEATVYSSQRYERATPAPVIKAVLTMVPR